MKSSRAKDRTNHPKGEKDRSSHGAAEQAELTQTEFISTDKRKPPLRRSGRPLIKPEAQGQKNGCASAPNRRDRQWHRKGTSGVQVQKGEMNNLIKNVRHFRQNDHNV